MYDFDCFGQLVHNTLKKGGKGTPCTFFLILTILIFFAKHNMSSNQVEGEIIKLIGKCDDHTIMIWVYEGANVIYFPS
jgi:hypothetical protein